jgi:hypothetical protein
VINFITVAIAKIPKLCHLKQIEVKFQDDIFSPDGDTLYCKMCDTKLVAEKRFKVQQHTGRNKPNRAMPISNKKKSVQMLLQQCSSECGNKS